MGLFDDYERSIYKHVWEGDATVWNICGGVPSDPKIIKGWVETKMGLERDDQIKNMVLQTMEERGLKIEDAVHAVADEMKLNGFKRDASRDDELYYEGRQLKAAIKESANIRWPKRRGWGNSNKGTRSFFAEHVFVDDERIFLGVSQPTGIQQSFVNTWRGTSPKNEEYVGEAKITFTVVSDMEIKESDWRDLWITAQHQGLGASRSQGYGRLEMTRWDKVAP